MTSINDLHLLPMRRTHRTYCSECRGPASTFFIQRPASLCFICAREMKAKLIINFWCKKILYKNRVKSFIINETNITESGISSIICTYI